MPRNYRHIDTTPETGSRAPSHTVTRETMGNLLRTLYITAMRLSSPRCAEYGSDAMPMWDGGEVSDGSIRKPVWPKLATRVMDLQLNPRMLIHAAFAEARGRKPPTPNALLSERTLAVYHQHCSRLTETLTFEFARQMRSLEVQLSLLKLHPQLTELQRMSMAIRDARVDATALFRYCIAVQFELAPALVRRYQDTALMQYMFEREYYDRAWDPSVIPATLRQAADELRVTLGY